MRSTLLGLSFSAILIFASGCESRSGSTSELSFCQGYTVVYDRAPEGEPSELEKLHPDTRAEIEKNWVTCSTLCPDLCPL